MYIYKNIIVIAGHNGEFALGQNLLAKVMTCPGFQVGGVRCMVLGFERGADVHGWVSSKLREIVADSS